MTRQDAAKLCKEELIKHGLNDWGVRLNPNPDARYLGLCSYKDKVIILNGYHCEIHPEPEVINTIKHEVAHALTPGMQHNSVWADKARELGCTSVAPCSHLSLSPEVIDAIRSGATIEMTYETEIIHKPKYVIHKLQNKCETCGKVAVEKKTWNSIIKGEEVKFIILECGHLTSKRIPKGTPFETLVSDPDDAVKSKCKHTWDLKKYNECTSCGAHRPYQFQVDGMKFIERGLAQQRGAGVFDEMGLGKTIQSLGYIKFHPEACPVLYVVKSGIKFQWYKAIVKWLGFSHLAQVINTGKDGIMPGLKSYIISYDLLRNFDSIKLINAGIKTMVLDECQQIKNPDSTRTAEVRALAKHIPHIIPLSGTPWKNRGSEFFVALNMLDAYKFPGYQNYLNRWVDVYYDGAKQKMGGIRNPEKFKEYTKDLIIRRERKEVMKELPDINRVKLYAQMERDEQAAYDKEVNEFVRWYNTAVIGGEEDSFETAQGMLARMARMRHITGLAKIPVTVAETEEFLEETDRKIVVFAHHRDVQQILFEQISKLDIVKEDNILVLQLDSSKSAEERFLIQERFNAAKRAVLIGSTLASGEGLNLQTCADCIMHERQWNPANEEQAEGRFIRIGQMAESVTAKYATAAGTIDDLFDGIVERKRVYFHTAMNKGELAKWNEQGIMKELAEAIVKTANVQRRK